MATELNPQGPHSSDHTRAVADTISEAVRVLNYATQHPDGLNNPADVADVLNRLSAATRGLPQTLLMMRRWIADEHQTERIGRDDPPTPHATADTAANALKEALTRARATAEALGDELAEAERVAAKLRPKD